MPQLAPVILAVHGVIVAVSKQVLVPVGLFGRHRYYGGIIRIDEAASCGVIVPALQVIQPTLVVVVVTTIAERIRLRHGALCGQNLPVGVIGIAGYGVSAGVQQGHYVTLQVGDVIIDGSARLHGIGLTGVVVEEIVCLRGVPGGDRLLQQLAPGVEVAVGGRLTSSCRRT